MIKLDMPGCGSVVSCFILYVIRVSVPCSSPFLGGSQLLLLLLLPNAMLWFLFLYDVDHHFGSAASHPSFLTFHNKRFPPPLFQGLPPPLLRGFPPIPGFPAHPSLGLPPSPGFPPISGFTPIPGVTPFPRFLVYLRPLISLNISVSELFFGFFQITC